jgi:hypothetical protein
LTSWSCRRSGPRFTGSLFGLPISVIKTIGFWAFTVAFAIKGPHLALPYLAARRPHRGPDGRLHDSGRGAPENWGPSVSCGWCSRSSRSSRCSSRGCWRCWDWRRRWLVASPPWPRTTSSGWWPTPPWGTWALSCWGWRWRRRPWAAECAHWTRRWRPTARSCRCSTTALPRRRCSPWSGWSMSGRTPAT